MEKRQDLILHLIGEMANYVLRRDPKKMMISLHQEEDGMHLCVVDHSKHSDEEIAELKKMMNSEKRPELAGYYGEMVGHDFLGKSRLDLIGWQVKKVDVSRWGGGIMIDIWMGGSNFQKSQFNMEKNSKPPEQP
jgi:hypothetical protein